MSTTNMEWQRAIRTEPEVGSNPQHHEGTVARSIEQQTAKLPSDWFLWAAVGSMAASLALQISGAEKKSLFIGQWAPSLLILGMYNKMVKLHGSDGTQSSR